MNKSKSFFQKSSAKDASSRVNPWLQKLVGRVAIPGIAVAALLLIAHVSLAQQAPPPAAKMQSDAPPVPALTPFVDAHAHFDEKDPDISISAALAGLDRENAVMIIFQILPDTFDHPGHYDAEVFLDKVKQHPGKLAVTGGGGTLNAMIVQAAATGDDSPETKKKFKERAEELLKEGVVGFGEISPEHFFGATPYHYAPADHPLLLMLADIAAEHGVPVDVHMEAVPQDMPTPAGIRSPPNPPQLHGNIAAFERLLSHNTRAKIIWAHSGSDNSGFRTVDLQRQLLMAHPNLYMEIKVDPKFPGKNYPLASDGTIKPDWLKLITDFPDRFILGSDQHYPEAKGEASRWQETVLLFNQLPANVRVKIGTENVAQIYGKPVASSLHAASH